MNNDLEIIGMPDELSAEDRHRCLMGAHAANELRKDMSRRGDAGFAGRLDLRCQSCAFRPDTEANRTAKTILSAARCAEYHGLFYCHEGETSQGLPITPCRGFLAARRIQFDEELAYEVADAWS